MVQTLVLATRFNNLQNRIDAVLGNPANTSSTTGYAQPVRSQQVEALNYRAVNWSIVSSVSNTSVITINNHGFQDGDLVLYSNGGNDDAYGLTDHTYYYVNRTGTNTFTLHTDLPVNDSTKIPVAVGGSTGTHSLSEVQGNKITADQWSRIYLDVMAARVHQTGTNPLADFEPVAQVDKIEEQILSDLENVMTSVEGNLFAQGTGQFELDDLRDGTNTTLSKQRFLNWNGTLTHEFSVNWQNANERQGYFNASGEIRFFSSITGGSGLKTNDWRSLLSNAGTVTFARAGTTTSGSANVAANVGNYNGLSSSYTIIADYQGSDYVDNNWDIAVREISPTEIRFRIRFQDLDNPPSQAPFFDIDEDVTGTLASSVQLFRPAGQFTVGTQDYVSVDIAPVTGTLLQSI
jgi:hypothetical protein